MNRKKVYFIAEAGVNHNGDKELALKLIDAAKDAGADAVKFQTFNAETLASSTAPKAKYQTENTNRNESQLEMLQKLELPYAWHHELQQHAKTQGIDFLSTAFDIKSLELLESMNLPFYKIPSGEIVNGPLLWQFARTRRPLVLSTGMANLSEVEMALAIITHALNSNMYPQNIEEIWYLWSDLNARAKLNDKITILHCTSQYPTPAADVNLAAMDTLKHAFNLPVGYSDHTQGFLIPIAAVARGACIIEKHFTLDKNLEGPDHKASIEVHELKELIANIRTLEESIGTGIKAPQACEWDTRKVARQSIVVASPLIKGDVIKVDDLKTARVGAGLSPNLIWQLIGSKSQKSFMPGDVFSHEF